MKKIISVILVLVFLFSLCGCKVNTENIESYIQNIETYVEDVESYISDVESYISEVETYVEDLADILPGEEIIVEEYYVFPPEFNAAYNSLSSKQKELYRKIYAVTEQMPEGYVAISKDYDNIINDISISYTAVLYDHPEIFWMPSTYIVGERESKFGNEILLAFNYQASTGVIEYAVSKTERDKMRKELDEKANAIISNIPETDSEYEKEKKINDYICQNTEYVKTGDFVDSAYGCLINGKALCEGYSKAFKLLCNKVNIECDLIVGYADDEGHMWNSVNIDNKHSFVDVTWNDRPEFPYLYFNITTEQILYDHTFLPLFSEVSNEPNLQGGAFNFVERICEFTGNSYYEMSGLALSDFNLSDYGRVAAEIIKNNANEEGSLQILLSGEGIKNEYEKGAERFLIKIQRHLFDYQITAYAFERDILIIYFE